MSFKYLRVVPMVSIFALGACSFASDALFPPLESEETETVEVNGNTTLISEQEVKLVNPASLDQTQYQRYSTPSNYRPASYGVENSGDYLEFNQQAPLKTIPGEKANQLRGELYQLHGTIDRHTNSLAAMRDKIANDAGRYHENVAFINSRLQVGTTPNNPVMLGRWQAAMAALENVNQDIIGLGQLSSQITADSAMTSYLLDSIRATYSLSGAVDEDHINLRRLEDQTNQAAILIERLSKEINDDVARQQQYVANERKNMATLSLAIRDGQLYGSSLSDPMAVASRSARVNMKDEVVSSLPKAKLEGRRPLMTIRFDRPNVSYEQPLYQVAKKALEKNPAVMFDVVAVTPDNGMAAGVYDARRYAEKVSASLINMGVPAKRIKLSAMNSPKATVSEVKLFVK